MTKKLITLISVLFTFFSASAQYSQDSATQAATQAVMQAAAKMMSGSDTIGIFARQSGKLIRMEPINFSGTRVNPLAASFTYGIARTKVKTTYRGTTSPYVFTNNTATFRVYFGNPSISQMQRYYMFANSSIRDLSVSKFQIKRNKRMLVNGSYSVWTGMRTGTETSDEISIQYSAVRDNVYDITVKALPGEYCLIINTAGAGGYMPVFDFTIK